MRTRRTGAVRRERGASNPRKYMVDQSERKDTRTAACVSELLRQAQASVLLAASAEA